MRTWRIIGMFAALLFLVVALTLHFAPEALAAADSLIAAWITPLQTYEGIRLFLAVTALGGGVGIIAVAVGFAYITRLDTVQALQLTLVLSAVAVLSKLLKEFFERTRPDPLQWFDILPSASFPSAHAASAMALYGFIAVLIYMRTRHVPYAVIPLMIILLVGLSRMVIGAHHFSDIIGGYLLGTVLLAVAFLVPLKPLLKRYG